MKMQALFEWWLIEIGEKVDMRIGFRADEFDRMERFFNGGMEGKLPAIKYLHHNELTEINYKAIPFLIGEIADLC